MSKNAYQGWMRALKVILAAALVSYGIMELFMHTF